MRTLSPRSRSIVFSGNLRSSSIRAALLAGAHGLVEKTASLGEFEQAVRSVGSGRIYYSRFASDEIRRIVNGSAGRRARPARLTDREKAVLRGLADGLSSKQIAAHLGLSRHTIVNHRARLARKTGLRGVARLSRYAAELGLVGEALPGSAAGL
jgi:DNA-binding NarL/FixJ family response regulator